MFDWEYVIALHAMPGTLASFPSKGDVSYDFLAWQDNTDTSGGEVGDQVSLSSFHRDIGIPMNFQEDSSLVSF